MVKKIVSIFLVSNIAYGQTTLNTTTAPKCEKDAQYLLYQDSAPCTGYLFSPEKEYEIRLKMESYIYLENFAQSQGLMIDTLQKRVDLARTQNQYLYDQLQKTKNTSFLENTLYFALGAILTGAIASNVK